MSKFSSCGGWRGEWKKDGLKDVEVVAADDDGSGRRPQLVRYRLANLVSLAVKDRLLVLLLLPRWLVLCSLYLLAKLGMRLLSNLCL